MADGSENQANDQTVAGGNVANGSTSATQTGSATATQATSTQSSQEGTSGSSSATGTNGTAETGSSLSQPAEPTPEEQFPQSHYVKPVHAEILASKAFKESGLLPPKEYYYYPDLPNEDDYQWVGYMPQDGETFYSFFQKYGVQPVDIRTWNPQTYERRFASYGGQYWMLRIKVSRLPHD